MSEDEFQPTEEDYTISDSGPLGARTSVGQIGGKNLGEFANDDAETGEDKAHKAIAEHMQKNQFFPNVWHVSDHGNWEICNHMGEHSSSRTEGSVMDRTAIFSRMVGYLEGLGLDTEHLDSPTSRLSAGEAVLSLTDLSDEELMQYASALAAFSANPHRFSSRHQILDERNEVRSELEYRHLSHEGTDIHDHCAVCGRDDSACELYGVDHDFVPMHTPTSEPDPKMFQAPSRAADKLRDPEGLPLYCDKCGENIGTSTYHWEPEPGSYDRSGVATVPVHDECPKSSAKQAAGKLQVGIEGVPGHRSFQTSEEAEKAVSKLQTEENKGKTIHIKREDGSLYAAYRHTMGDDGYAMWHRYDSLNTESSKQAAGNCPSCSGSGKCPTCRGSGSFDRGNGEETCQMCHGSKKCGYCGGSGDVKESAIGAWQDNWVNRGQGKCRNCGQEKNVNGGDICEDCWKNEDVRNEVRRQESSKTARTDPGWGELYGDPTSEHPSYLTHPDQTPVWMHRKGGRVRFFDENGTQVGPEHKNVAPAVVWASMHGWVDPTSPIQPSMDPQVRKYWDENGGIPDVNSATGKCPDCGNTWPEGQPKCPTCGLDQDDVDAAAKFFDEHIKVIPVTFPDKSSTERSLAEIFAEGETDG